MSGTATSRSTFIGWKSRDRNRFFLAVAGCGAAYFGVLFSEWRERNRRHSSIQKDIEREAWRAKVLGREADRSDDGFASQYIEQLKDSGKYKVSLEQKL